MTRHRRSRREVLRRIGTASTAAIGVALAGCGGGGGGDGGDGGGDNTVDMTTDLSFEPSSLAVGTGTTVTWENTGTVAHTVTAYEAQIPSGAAYFASGGFDSESAARDGYASAEGLLEADDQYQHTFETAGTYEYFCIPHESSGMTGSVTVE